MKLFFILILFVLIFNLSKCFAYEIKNFSYGRVFFEISPKCKVNLKSGWNLISVCSNESGELKEVFKYNLTNFRFVLRWNESKKLFEVYSPKAIENSFNSIDLRESYFILVYNNFDLGYTKERIGNMEIGMYEGWNNPSWPYEFNVSILKYFNTSLHRFLMKWNKSRQEFDIYSPRAIYNPFANIYVGEGQFIFSKIDHILIYNRTYLENG